MGPYAPPTSGKISQCQGTQMPVAACHACLRLCGCQHSSSAVPRRPLPLPEGLRPNKPRVRPASFVDAVAAAAAPTTAADCHLNTCWAPVTFRSGVAFKIVVGTLIRSFSRRIQPQREALHHGLAHQANAAPRAAASLHARCGAMRADDGHPSAPTAAAAVRRAGGRRPQHRPETSSSPNALRLLLLLLLLLLPHRLKAALVCRRWAALVRSQPSLCRHTELGLSLNSPTCVERTEGFLAWLVPRAASVQQLTVITRRSGSGDAAGEALVWNNVVAALALAGPNLLHLTLEWSGELVITAWAATLTALQARPCCNSGRAAVGAPEGMGSSSWARGALGGSGKGDGRLCCWSGCSRWLDVVM